MPFGAADPSRFRVEAVIGVHAVVVGQYPGSPGSSVYSARFSALRSASTHWSGSAAALLGCGCPEFTSGEVLEAVEERLRPAGAARTGTGILVAGLGVPVSPGVAQFRCGLLVSGEEPDALNQAGQRHRQVAIAVQLEGEAVQAGGACVAAALVDEEDAHRVAFAQINDRSVGLAVGGVAGPRSAGERRSGRPRPGGAGGYACDVSGVGAVCRKALGTVGDDVAVGSRGLPSE